MKTPGWMDGSVNIIELTNLCSTQLDLCAYIGYRIRGYIDMEKFAVNLDLIYWLDRTSSKKEGYWETGVWMGGIILLARGKYLFITVHQNHDTTSK